ncbi:Class III cytochrome C family protein [Malonomonas rubra DSM 5091]|uniref:Class III cytochrome C family protein n=1 Tax=Malonomonas rubra DSM 5091 TaxID=1122189 RepID=A0A1M6E856_MALRU|nr:cytochrome c3 family protein [Malonomonas rubra]SHI81677.1 Class III cytochrome C family protein [Malonomonas rubra DSM 5091]
MKKMLVLFAIVAFVAASAFVAVAQDKGPASITMEVKMGNVTFDHAKHQGLTDCATCHHTGDFAACKSCHDVKPEAPKSKKAYHDQCKGCHKKESGPTKCKGCHVK